MKRRGEVDEILSELRMDAHPGEFFEALESWVINLPRNEKGMTRLLKAIQARNPESFAAAIYQMAIPKRGEGTPKKYRDDAFLVASWLNSGKTPTAFCRDECHIDPDDRSPLGMMKLDLDRDEEALRKRLGRLKRHYETNAAFKQEVESKLRLLRDITT